MITYHFKLTERELELVLTALGLLIEDDTKSDHAGDAKEARNLQVRLDVEGDEQFADHQDNRQSSAGR
jgi:hypothetical protein